MIIVKYKQIFRNMTTTILMKIFTGCMQGLWELINSLYCPGERP